MPMSLSRRAAVLIKGQSVLFVVRDVRAFKDHELHLPKRWIVCLVPRRKGAHALKPKALNCTDLKP